MIDAKPGATTMKTSQWKSEGVADGGQNLMEHLMCLVQRARPDIAFAVNFLSEFNNSF